MDTFGGKMDPADNGQYEAAARRELDEEFQLPEDWKDALDAALSQTPMMLELIHPSRKTKHHLAEWFVEVANDKLPKLKPMGSKEVRPHTLAWRPLPCLLANLRQFRFATPVVAALRQMAGAAFAEKKTHPNTCTDKGTTLDFEDEMIRNELHDLREDDLREQYYAMNENFATLH